MAVKNKIKELLESRGKTRYWFWKATDLSQNTAYRLCNDPAYIPGSDVMDVVCRVLDVQPGDFLEYVPSAEVSERDRTLTAGGTP